MVSAAGLTVTSDSGAEISIVVSDSGIATSALGGSALTTSALTTSASAASAGPGEAGAGEAGVINGVRGGTHGATGAGDGDGNVQKTDLLQYGNYLNCAGR